MLYSKRIKVINITYQDQESKIIIQQYESTKCLHYELNIVIVLHQQ